jgi:hypothetical protein
VRKILLFKHWQLFLFIVLPAAWISPSPLEEIINSISIIVSAIWIYAIGVFGYEKIQALGLREMNIKFFKISIVAGTVVLLLVLFFPSEKESFYGFVNIPLIIALMYSLFSIVYTTIFACKILVTIEQKRNAITNDWLGMFMLMIFLFIGIWFIQPKVNRLIATKDLN